MATNEPRCPEIASHKKTLPYLLAIHSKKKLLASLGSRSTPTSSLTGGSTAPSLAASATPPPPPCLPSPSQRCGVPAWPQHRRLTARGTGGATMPLGCAAAQRLGPSGALPQPWRSASRPRWRCLTPGARPPPVRVCSCARRNPSCLCSAS